MESQLPVFNNKFFVFDGEGKTFTNKGIWSGAHTNHPAQTNSFEVKLDKENSDKLKTFLENFKGSL